MVVWPNPLICSGIDETEKRKWREEHGSVGAKGEPKTAESCKREALKHGIVTQVRFCINRDLKTRRFSVVV